MKRNALILAVLFSAACGEKAGSGVGGQGTASTAPASSAFPQPSLQTTGGQAAVSPQPFGTGAQPSVPPADVVLVWVTADPLQCRNNAWDKFDGLGGLPGFFKSKGINVYSEVKHSFNLLYGREVPVTRSCTSPEGHALFVQVAEKDAPGMAAFGFKISTVDPRDADSYFGSRRSLLPPPPGGASVGPSAEQPARKAPAKKKRRKKRA